MSSVCRICHAKLAGRGKANCSKCGSDFHGKCANLNQDIIDGLSTGNISWQCNECRTSKPSEPTLADILRELRGFRASNEDLATSLQACLDEIRELKLSVVALETKLVATDAQIELLECEKVSLQKDNCALSERLNDSEQYSRINCLEINGVPNVPGENIVETIKLVSRAIDFPFEESMVDACHRLAKNPHDPQQPQGIIIKFLRRSDKENMLAKRKVKSNFNTSHLDESLARRVKTPNNIYVNESLTKTNRILLSKSREYKRNNGVKYVWVKNGKILMRKTDNSRVYQIKSVKDFLDVH